MIPDDPLIRALQTADAAAAPPQPAGDLPRRVRQRHAQQVQTANRLKFGAAFTVAVLILLATSLRLWQPPVPPGGAAPVDNALVPQPPVDTGAAVPNHISRDPAEIARLRTQADAFGAQADALEHQLHLARDEQAQQDLREEYRRQLAADALAQTDQSPIDRAALIALCQGDYYRDQQAPAPAQAAYQSVLDNFPQSRWAVVAKQRLIQIEMN